jgi:hypothetical protein
MNIIIDRKTSNLFRGLSVFLHIKFDNVALKSSFALYPRGITDKMLSNQVKIKKNFFCEALK